MKVNVYLKEGCVLSNMIITTQLELPQFVKNVKFENGLWSNDMSKFVPIDNIAYYELYSDKF